MKRVRRGLMTVPNALETLAPEVSVAEFASDGPKLAVRPYVLPVHHDQVPPMTTG